MIRRKLNEFLNIIDEKERNLILETMQIMTAKTSGCIRFVERNSGSRNWVNIVKPSPNPNAVICNSFVIIL